MYTIERKEEIINFLERDGKVDVAMLSQHFGASKETIRRDLRDLEQDGLLRRTHGGAVLAEPNKETNEYPLLVRGMQRNEEKNLICRRAAQFIQDGDTIFIDNSSTTINLIKYINKDIRVTVLTNSIQVLLESAKVANNNILVISLGGIFRPNNFSTYGSISVESGKSFYPSKAFLSCNGISQTKMLTDTSVYEVETKRSMIEQSSQTFILADYTKFSTTGTVFLTDLSAVDTIITDAKANPEALQYLDKYHIRLVVAE